MRDDSANIEYLPSDGVILDGGAQIRIDSYCDGIEIYSTNGDTKPIIFDMEYVAKIQKLYASFVVQGLLPAGWKLVMKEHW